MKKTFAFAAMAAILFGFASCNKAETPSDNPSDKEGDGDKTEVKYRVLEDFENGGILTWTGSNGATFEIAANPSAKGVNTSSKVGKVTCGGQQWEFTWSTYFGVTETETNPKYLDFTNDGYIIKVDVYSPKKDAPVYLKLEGDGVDAKEISTVKTTKANEWETLAFDYEPMSVVNGAYRNFVIIFDAGNVTTQGEVYYYDNIRQCKE